jgi:hypothetical protein
MEPLIRLHTEGLDIRPLTTFKAENTMHFAELDRMVSDE